MSEATAGGNVPGRAAIVMAALLVGFHLYNSFTGLLPNLLTRPAHLALAIPFILVLDSAGGGRAYRYSGYGVAAVGLAACAYIIFNREALIYQYGALDGWFQFAIAIALILVVLEMARRAIRAVLPAVAGLALLYGAYGEYIPGYFGHPGFDNAYFLGNLIITEGGLWGPLTGVSVDTISLFVVLGGFITAGQAGKGFMTLATQIAGRLRAGAAKVAVLASAFYGSISGVAAANTATTGMVTIPAMQRMGYPSRLAGAVEAVASTGGQILPPVMGAGAFVMAELVGRPYTEIMVAAILPALLFFVTAWLGVHYYALRAELPGLQRSELPGWPAVARALPFFLVPLGILVGTLAFTSYTLPYAAVFATLATWVTLIADPEGGISLGGWWQRSLIALVTGARQVALIAAVIICAGIIVGVFNMTGLGVKLTSLILEASGGNIWLALILTGLAALVLGMELPTTAAYVITAAVAAPALIELGVPTLYAHLFVFWYALLCTITPPVCGNVFIAAGIAQTNWLPVAGNALRLGVALFVIPMGFIANQNLLLIAEAPVAALLTAGQLGVGMALLSFALIGARRTWRLDMLRPLALAAAFLVVFDPMGWLA